MQWAEEGWYDFCSLPFAAKMQMSLPDEDTMRQIASNYDGQFTNCVVRASMYVLKHAQNKVSWPDVEACSSVSGKHFD